MAHDPYDVTIILPQNLGILPYPEQNISIGNEPPFIYVTKADVPVGQPGSVKRKGAAKAKAPAASTSTPDIPPIPTIQCHNTLPSLSLTLKHPLPSWNAILGFGHWQRARLKKAIQDDFLSALRASAADCSTRTTSARSTLSIAAATLDSYQRTMQERRRLKSRKSASARKKRSAPKS